MLCNRTAKLQHRMGEICHFEMLREFLLTAFSSCKAIIFLNYNMIYKSLLSFIFLRGTDSKWNVFSQNINFSQELTKWGVKRNIFCNQVFQSLGLCWHICGWMLAFRVLGSVRLSSHATHFPWVTPATLKALILTSAPVTAISILPTPQVSPELQVPVSNYPLRPPSCPTDSSISNSFLSKLCSFYLNPRIAMILTSIEISKVQFLLSGSL